MSVSGMKADRPLALDEVLADIRQLPSLPAVISELVRTLDDDLANIDQLAEGIAKDQSLSARALRVANSPFYGIQHKVASIHDAIVILGFRAVGSLVTAASVTGYFPSPAGLEFDLARFWRHGIGTALCARALAQESGQDAETAFTAGLLHDIGVLVLLTTRPRHYRQVLSWRHEQDCTLIDAENHVLGFDHARVGEALAQRWLFPEEISRAVALHHAPEGNALNGKASLADVVHIANVLSHALDLARASDALVPLLQEAAWQRLNLSTTRLKHVLADIEHEHESYCALLAG